MNCWHFLTKQSRLRREISAERKERERVIPIQVSAVDTACKCEQIRPHHTSLSFKARVEFNLQRHSQHFAPSCRPLALNTNSSSVDFPHLFAVALRASTYYSMSDKLTRTIARFQQRIDNKDFYEAHQTLRTICNRYVHARNYDLAAEILAQGAAILANNHEYASAADLITYLVLVYADAGYACLGPESKYRATVAQLVCLLPDTDPSLVDLAKTAMAWSQREPEQKFGDASLHDVFGSKLLAAARLAKTDDARQTLFAVAELHLILALALSMPVYVEFLHTWYSRSAAADPGPFLARAVINYAYLRNLKLVRGAIDLFLELGTPETASDLMSFLRLLAATLSKAQSGEKFMKLYNHYKPVLAEHELVAPVEYIGREYFQLRLGSSLGGNNMLANLMGGLFK